MLALLFLMRVVAVVGFVAVFFDFHRRCAYRAQKLFEILVDGVVLAVEKKKLELLDRHHLPEASPIHAQL